MERINIDGDYLLIAPNKVVGSGYHHMLIERAFLADNILAFLDNHKVDIHAITIYELKEINEHTSKEGE